MADDDIETEDMVILTVCTQYFGESSSSLNYKEIKRNQPVFIYTMYI
jgi:hypothetical protein